MTPEPSYMWNKRSTRYNLYMRVGQLKVTSLVVTPRKGEVCDMNVSRKEGNVLSYSVSMKYITFVMYYVSILLCCFWY